MSALCSSPLCSRTMYSAHQACQSSSRWPVPGETPHHRRTAHHANTAMAVVLRGFVRVNCLAKSDI